MIIDSSALVAILYRKDDAALFAQAIADAPARQKPAAQEQTPARP